MDCFDCGNCRQNEAMYYCPSKNDFFVREKHVVVERERTDQGWKKGNPEYEKHRRRVRQNDLEQIG